MKLNFIAKAASFFLSASFFFNDKVCNMEMGVMCFGHKWKTRIIMNAFLAD